MSQIPTNEVRRVVDEIRTQARAANAPVSLPPGTIIGYVGVEEGNAWWCVMFFPDSDSERPVEYSELFTVSSQDLFRHTSLVFNTHYHTTNRNA